MNKPIRNALILSCGITITGCHKTAVYTSPAIGDYLPLYAGHCITYQLDSIVYTHFGTVPEQHSYMVKDSIENPVSDAGGRASWRVVRYYRNEGDTSVWQPVNAYMITPLASTIELVENNLRYVKLSTPVQDLHSWGGNAYLPFEPFNYLFDFSDADHTHPGGWNYVYQDLFTTGRINELTFSNTITVACSGVENTNFPPLDLDRKGVKTVWVEQYATGVGLVYKDIVMQEYQPVSPSVAIPYYTGFELKMSIIAYQ